MDIAKSLSRPNNGRRSFLWKAGAALTAAVAYAAPGMANSRANQGNDSDVEINGLSHQLGTLQDEKAIRAVHQAYKAHLDNGRYEEVVDLFAENAEVVFNGGVFKGKRGIARLYQESFSSGLTGKSIGTAPGFAADATQAEAVSVAADRMTAKAEFPYSIQVGAPMASESSLVNMARLHGGGIVKWHESGVYAISYAKDARTGSWQMHRLEYRVSSQTDYRPGKAYADPISVPSFVKLYPEDPAGPDSLIIQA
jgi:hypothetical protein